MAISIFDINILGTMRFNFLLRGDGVSTVATFDLTRAPFNMDFKENPPSSAFANVVGGGFTITCTLKETMLTMTCSLPPPAGDVAGGFNETVELNLGYNG
jgi:hypothetical protein